MVLRGLKIGCMFGFGYLVMFIALAVSCLVCATIIANDSNLDKKAFVFGIKLGSWCGWIAGNSFFFSANSSKGKRSANSVFSFLDKINE